MATVLSVSIASENKCYFSVGFIIIWEGWGILEFCVVFFFLLLPVTCTLKFSLFQGFLDLYMNVFLQLVTVSQRVLQMMGHACRKLHPQNSLGNVSVRIMCLDGNVISVFQGTGDTEEIHLENAEVSFPFNCSFLLMNKVFDAKRVYIAFRSKFIFCRIELIFGRLTCFDMKSNFA